MIDVKQLIRSPTKLPEKNLILSIYYIYYLKTLLNSGPCCTLKFHISLKMLLLKAKEEEQFIQQKSMQINLTSHDYVP